MNNEGLASYLFYIMLRHVNITIFPEGVTLKNNVFYSKRHGNSMESRIAPKVDFNFRLDVLIMCSEKRLEEQEGRDLL